MNDELEYLTWLAMRSGEYTPKRTYDNYGNFTIPIPLYEEWIRFLAEEHYPNYYYQFASFLYPPDTTPRSKFIPWTLTLPPRVIPTCNAILYQIGS